MVVNPTKDAWHAPKRDVAACCEEHQPSTSLSDVGTISRIKTMGIENRSASTTHELSIQTFKMSKCYEFIKTCYIVSSLPFLCQPQLVRNAIVFAEPS
jgi:hypothetical protein